MESYHYDDLQRLATASADGQGAVNYGYDPLGNLRYKGDYSKEPTGQLLNPYDYSVLPVNNTCGPNVPKTITRNELSARIEDTRTN